MSDNQNTAQIELPLELLRKTRVHIMMPCYGGMLTESTFMSFIKWANTARQLQLDWTMETMTNESLICRARNTLTAKFLNNEQSTHCMFIDSDIGWEPWHLLVLLSHDVDVIGGLYPMKTLPVKWCVNGVDKQPEGLDPNLVEVSKTGTGFMLIKRHVFDKLNNHPAVIPFNNDVGLEKDLDKNMKTYFTTVVRDQRYYSEDWAFCENWRDLGGQVFVDKRILLKHTGTYTFDYLTQEKLYRDLQAIIEPQTIPVKPTNTTTPAQVSVAEKTLEPEPEVLISS